MVGQEDVMYVFVQSYESADEYCELDFDWHRHELFAYIMGKVKTMVHGQYRNQFLSID